VEIHYALGAGDPATAEGGLLIALQQAFDEYERKKLSRETKRGMRQSALQGFRCGGRPPYGYTVERSPHPTPARAQAGETKARLVPNAQQAPVIAEIFHLWADKGWGCKAIAEHLNRPGGPPSPAHVDAKRNIHGDWAKSTIRAILKNPTHTGRLVWNRLDFATQREAGGTARLRAQEEWVVSEVEHLPLVSDELFAAAQERFRQRSRATGARGKGQAAYLLTGMIRCAAGHQPLAMYGRKRKDHTYMTCDYGRTYGKVAADQIEGHGQWLSVREDALVPLVESFFAERIFGPMRLEKLARQLQVHQRESARQADGAQRQLREEIAELDERIGRLIEALERGMEPDLIGARLAKLRDAKEKAEIELRALTPAAADPDAPDPAELLERLPDLSRALRKAPPQLKRQVFDAFGLQITYDKIGRRIEISATITAAIADALENEKSLPKEALDHAPVAPRDIAGAGFEPATFGL
ncbi:MAG: recombinase family protein, partial [Chloroflexota bacterium]|nr:recombinase family protein [Chloroflexota bacterium]